MNGTKLGNSADAKHAGQISTTGMIGGGWRVDGRGGPSEILLVIQSHPGADDNVETVVRLDRQGSLLHLSREQRPGVKGGP